MPPKTRTAPKGLTVFERRMADPFGRESHDIPLGEHMKAVTLRWFTRDKEHQDRHYKAVHHLGYVPVKKDDLAIDAQELGLTISPEGHVINGEKGEHRLMWIPTKEYEQIQQRKAEENLKAVKPKKLKAEVAQATAKAYGEEAAEQIDKHYSQVDRREPVDVA